MNPFQDNIDVELHIHTEDSRYDSAVKVQDAIERAKELGGKKIAITEHGVLTGIDHASKICSEIGGIELVPAMEAYVRLTPESPEGRCHMCIYAMDDVGYQAIGEASSDSFLHMEKEIPVMTLDILNRYFGKNGYGHGHVIVSSACIGGILANVLQINEICDREIAKKKKEVDKTGFKEIDSAPLQAVEKEIKELEENIEKLDGLANKKYGVRTRALKKMENDENYESMKKALDDEIEETETAKARIKEWKAKKKELSKKRTVLRNEQKLMDEKKEKCQNLLSKIEDLNSRKHTPQERYEMAKKYVKFYQNIFGEDCFYIEVQNHRMDEEKKVFPLLAKIAKEMNVPLVATNDAHMVFGDENSRRARQLMRSIRYIESKKAGEMWQEESPADKELYIKSNRELFDILSEILPEEDCISAIRNRKELLDRCHAPLEVSPHYPKYPDAVNGESSEECLRRKAKEGISKRFPDGFPDNYRKRMEYELDVMCSMGYADYHLIVQDYVNYTKLLGKFDFTCLPDGFSEHIYDIPWLEEKSKGLIGCGIGPARGSAAGSLVCYLLGITDIDPIQYGLLFERFLNPERVSMPDIDVDFAIHLREYAFNYVAYKYGSEKVCHIMTKNSQMPRKAIDNCSKLLGDRLQGSTTCFTSIANTIKNSLEDDNFPPEDVILNKFSEEDRKIAMQIYRDAKIISSTFVSYGMHAAGVVISDGTIMKKRVPLMLDSSGAWKTQCGMVEVEESHGLLKMDFLGLKNLNIITDCTRLVQKTRGISIDIDHIPFEPEVFQNIYGKGFTNGIFQTESAGMKEMMIQANPQSIEDIIILISMYRPGPIDSLPTLLPIMAGKKEPVYLAPELKPILKKTYGQIVYQEQVMQIFQQLAGYSLGGADLVRRFMSKKKEEKLAKERPVFIHGDKERGIKGCVANGISEENAEKLFDQMYSFAKYAFNKSHAAAYAVISYQTAFLKYHYPAEFICTCLNWYDADEKKGNKRKKFLEDCKILHIPVHIPDINQSDADFSIKDGEIWFGLRHVLSVGAKADEIVEERNLNGPYLSFADFIERMPFSGSKLSHLIYGGAFDSFLFTQNRNSLDVYTEGLKDTIKQIKDKKKIIQDENASQKQVYNAKSSLLNIRDSIQHSKFPETAFSNRDSLLMEKKMLGVMLSSHLTEGYQQAEDIHGTKISQIQPTKEKISCVGAVTNLKILDNKQMAFFDLDAPDASIPVCVFTKTYKTCEKLMQEGNVLVVTGKVSEKKDFKGESYLQFVASAVKQAQEKKKYVIVYGKKQSKEEWRQFHEKLNEFLVEEELGIPLVLYNGNANKFITDTKMFVSKKILESDFITQVI